MRRADLTKAHLAESDLTGAKLRAANLTPANLTRASLTGAGLKRDGATLTRADFTDAMLIQADLPDTDLTGAFSAERTLPTHGSRPAKFPQAGRVPRVRVGWRRRAPGPDENAVSSEGPDDIR